MTWESDAMNNWPFPTKEQPLTPWTPAQQKKWAEEQLKNLPDSPL